MAEPDAARFLGDVDRAEHAAGPDPCGQFEAALQCDRRAGGQQVQAQHDRADQERDEGGDHRAADVGAEAGVDQALQR